MTSHRNTLALFAAASLIFATATHAQESPPQPDAAQLERGKYLVTTSGCHDCHTPLKLGPNGPELDEDRALSGHPEQLVMPPAP
ncbi:MAG: diheme cytochrome c-553, partial [Pseudomonadota bacterium]|nr:diheme cytochrome c-553 [Pseudomonadota bacterium]